MSTTFETVMSTTEKRERAESEATEGLDEQALAKKARKDARVLRNRQSAQRSRNQRKNEMVYLQSRVAELEEENRRLREQSSSTASMSSPSTSTSSRRLATPEQQVMTLAGDLGLPPSLVSSGVKLSSVAPQQTGVESPVVKEEFIARSQTSSSEVDRLLAENRALVERVQMLETLVKHVVALSDLSGLNAKPSTASTSTSLDTLALPQPSAHSDYLDFNSFVNPTIEETPSVPVTQMSPELRTPTWSGEEANPNHPIACHSAAGEGNRFELASQLDYQGTFESGRQSISGFGQDEGLDFGRIFALPETGAVEENTDVTVAHEQEAAVEQWEEELKQMLAGFEESSSAFDTPPTTDFYDWGQVVGEIELTG